MSTKTRTAITTEIGTLLADNSAGAITPSSMRTVVQDLADSCINPQSDTTADKIGFGWSGGGTALTTSAEDYEVPIPIACTVTGWQVVVKPAGSVTVSVKKATAAGSYVASAIDGGTGPSTSSARFNSSTSLGSWTATTFAAGDIAVFSISSASIVTNVTGLLKIAR